MSQDDRSHDVVRLARARNPFEAHVWEQALKEKGIQCSVSGDFLDAGIGDIPGLNAEVWVHRDDLARAQEILRQGQAVADEEPEEES
jgi:hypothetical protein